jgi:hypothetical protein
LFGAYLCLLIIQVSPDRKNDGNEGKHFQHVVAFTQGQKWSWIKFEASCELIFAYFSKNLPESIDPYATS